VHEQLSALVSEGIVPKDYIETDERTYHRPQYFEKEVKIAADGTKTYQYQRASEKYWKAREAGDWSDAWRIYDDDCEPFY